MTPRQTASTSGIKASFLLLSSFSVKLVWIQVSTTWRWRWPPRRRDRSGSAGHIISDQSISQDPLLYEIKIVVRIQGEIWKIRNAISSISNPPKRRNRWWLFKCIHQRNQNFSGLSLQDSRTAQSLAAEKVKVKSKNTKIKNLKHKKISKASQESRMLSNVALNCHDYLSVNCLINRIQNQCFIFIIIIIIFKTSFLSSWPCQSWREPSLPGASQRWPRDWRSWLWSSWSWWLSWSFGCFL